MNLTEKQIKRQIKLNAAKMFEKLWDTPIDPTDVEIEAHNAAIDENRQLEVELRRLISERI